MLVLKNYYWYIKSFLSTYLVFCTRLHSFRTRHAVSLLKCKVSVFFVIVQIALSYIYSIFIIYLSYIYSIFIVCCRYGEDRVLRQFS